jgi:hypothetical protein
MDVWDDSADRRSGHSSGRIRRWKQSLVFLAQLSGLIIVASGAAILVFTSLGFKVSGSGEAIADIRKADAARDTAISQIRRQSERFGSKLDAVTWLVCEKAKRDDRSMILPRECSQASPNPDPQ